jgi:hypothetical protein
VQSFATYPISVPGHGTDLFGKSALVRFATHAEEIGIDGIGFTDHPAPTHQSRCDDTPRSLGLFGAVNAEQLNETQRQVQETVTEVRDAAGLAIAEANAGRDQAVRTAQNYGPSWKQTTDRPRPHWRTLGAKRR